MESHDVLEAKSWPVFAGKMVKQKKKLLRLFGELGDYFPLWIPTSAKQAKFTDDWPIGC